MPRRKSTHVDSPVEVGRRLREARERAGLSQRQLSFPGCSPAYISRIEAGDRIPSLQLLREMGRRLGVSEDYLATGSERHDENAVLVEAEINLRLDEREAAARLYGEALAQATTSDEQARALAGLGQLAFREGKPREAITRLEEARAVGQVDLADYPGWADTLGRAYALVDQLDAATSLFESSLRSAEARHDTVEAIRFAVLLANALIDKTDFDAAEQLLARIPELTDASDPVVRARLYWSQSRLAAAQEDHHRAARYARHALDLLELTEHTYYTAQAHQLLAHIELDRNEPRDALNLLEKGLDLLADTGTPVDVAVFKLEEARALIQLDRPEEAASLALEATGMLANASPYDAGRGYAVVADVYAELGDTAKAIEIYELAAERMSSHPSRYLMETYEKLAALLEGSGRKDEALGVLRKAVAVQTQPA
jgi:transcriptional regulator with XRE-family HTH domain/predicted negative regulator of RcsB-dependent stress response